MSISVYCSPCYSELCYCIAVWIQIYIYIQTPLLPNACECCRCSSWIECAMCICICICIGTFVCLVCMIMGICLGHALMCLLVYFTCCYWMESNVVFVLFLSCYVVVVVCFNVCCMLNYTYAGQYSSVRFNRLYIENITHIICMRSVWVLLIENVLEAECRQEYHINFNVRTVVLCYASFV